MYPSGSSDSSFSGFKIPTLLDGIFVLRYNRNGDRTDGDNFLNHNSDKHKCLASWTDTCPAVKKA